MKEKVDKQIKRFLKSRSENVKISSIMKSSYYDIKIDENLFKIRFSDHKSSIKTDVHLEIISISSGYIIYFDGCSLFANDENALKIIKSLLLILPEVLKSQSQLKSIISIQQTEFTKLKSRHGHLEKKYKAKTDYDKVIELYKNEKIEALNKLEEVVKENNLLKQKIIKFKNKMNSTMNLLEDLKKNLKAFS